MPRSGNAEPILAAYAAMQFHHGAKPDLEYEVWRRNGSQFCVARQGREPITAADEGELLFLLEKELTIELQKSAENCISFTPPSRPGLVDRGSLRYRKLTTAWTLSHHGFDYLSDELAPVALDSLRVQPYPHALCLKGEPPLPYSLPVRSVRTSSTLHVHVTQMPNSAVSQTMPLSAMFFLEYCPELEIPTGRTITKAEAAARLFVNALDPLVHEQDGLAGAARISQRVSSFHLKSADLGLTCELVRAILDNELGKNADQSDPTTAAV